MALRSPSNVASTRPGSPARAGCPVCGEDCNLLTHHRHALSFPFLPGGIRPMQPDSVITPHRIESPPDALGCGRVLYSPGDRVPWDEAVRLGLVFDIPVNNPSPPPAANVSTGGTRPAPAATEATEPSVANETAVADDAPADDTANEAVADNPAAEPQPAAEAAPTHRRRGGARS